MNRNCTLEVDYTSLQRLNFSKELHVRPLSLLLTTYLAMYWLQNLILPDSSIAAVRKINSCAEDNVGTSIWFTLPFLLKFGGNVKKSIFCALWHESVCPEINAWTTINYCHFSGGSRIFPRGVRQLPKLLLFFKFLPKTAWKWKNLDPQGGRASLAPPLDPPMHFTKEMDSLCIPCKYSDVKVDMHE